eukprot:gb/GECH01003785.1/.p1 GENE.gb/GECH01003785.1/~~gb/GECH01003785.1/.p1  ORF type:complete len:308 (+),score=30.57 gb/GECH01003785.1/:1-924(+)
MIRGDDEDEQYKFLYRIVSNSKNGVDVVKFDYLLRDSLNTGISVGFSYERIIAFSRVIEKELYFDFRESFNIWQIFSARYNLHKQIYSHRVVLAVEMKLGEILTTAQNYLGLKRFLDGIAKIKGVKDLLDEVKNGSEKAEEWRSYLMQYAMLTDSIIIELERMSMKKNQEIQDKTLQKIEELRKRNLARYVCAATVKEKVHQVKEKVEDEGLKDGKYYLSVHVRNFYLDQKKKKNPLDRVNFAHKGGGGVEGFQAKHLGEGIPLEVEETLLTVFCHTEDLDFLEKMRGKVKTVFECDTNCVSITPSK